MRTTLESDDLMKIRNIMREELQASKLLENPQYISENQLKKLLNVKAKSTILNLRNQGLITFSAVTKKNLIYEYESVLNFIRSRSNHAFNPSVS